jgi:hypothetical protein
MLCSDILFSIRVGEAYSFATIIAVLGFSDATFSWHPPSRSFGERLPIAILE